ncbi:MAG: hypothetical protein HKN21_15395 [Candidatus Eisenbacteria bacterium]|uniref:DNRLRE domain-containing protein n=1 Tax=Eiseniibacteriota bacterium TaxID=2212470 RepID=A0A7Y2EAB9_UNCEI|nr:hypothetical protein [Candidatus Eisenbacteria bacterium]
MKQMMKMMGVALLGITLMFGTATAEVYTASLAPSNDALLPDSEGDLVDVAFKFDLSGLETGDKTVIRAYLEWVVPGVDAYGETGFTIHEITALWVDALVESGVQTISSSSDEEAEWSIEERDYNRHGGYAKLHLTELVSDWLSGAATNHGVLLCMSDGDRTSLASGLDDARLTIVYKVD